MRNPFTYRPNADESSWDDTYISNAMAWGSKTFTPAWCQTEDHWSAKLMNHFWADCACCLFFRGITLGVALSALVAVLVLCTLYNLP